MVKRVGWPSVHQPELIKIIDQHNLILNSAKGQYFCLSNCLIINGNCSFELRNKYIETASAWINAAYVLLSGGRTS